MSGVSTSENGALRYFVRRTAIFFFALVTVKLLHSAITADSRDAFIDWLSLRLLPNLISYAIACILGAAVDTYFARLKPSRYADPVE